MDKNKVYCAYCKYFLNTVSNGGGYECHKTLEHESWIDGKKEADIVWDCYRQNKNNDCKYYEYRKYKGI